MFTLFINVTLKIIRQFIKAKKTLDINHKKYENPLLKFSM